MWDREIGMSTPSARAAFTEFVHRISQHDRSRIVLMRRGIGFVGFLAVRPLAILEVRMLGRLMNTALTRFRRGMSWLFFGQVDLSTRLAEIDAKLSDKGVMGQLTQVEQDVRAVLRRLALQTEQLPYPNRLTAQRFRGMSQNEEDGITLALMQEMGPGSRRFVEIGCGDNGGNSGFLALECGWSGLMVDGDASRIAVARSLYAGGPVSVVQTWITCDKINELIQMHGLDGDIDLLSIDIDGNDYWIWDAIHVCHPRAVVVEYNSLFGADLAVTIPYQEDFHHKKYGKGYYGASLQALTHLASRKGYRLVAVEPRGVNAYFLRNDIAPHVPACDARESFRSFDKISYRNILRKLEADPIGYFSKRGLTLVDVSREAVSERRSY